jgi:hypothetical protein
MLVAGCNDNISVHAYHFTVGHQGQLLKEKIETGRYDNNLALGIGNILIERIEI